MGYILMYHEVLPDGASIPAWTVVRENDFRWQIAFLQRHYDIVSTDEAMARVTGHTNGQRPFVVITFDDGYSGNLSTVLPIMREFNAPFTVYVATKAIEDRSIYWYDKIINLLKSSEDVEWSSTVGGANSHFRIPGRGSDNQRWVAIQRLLTWLKSLSECERCEEVGRIVERYPGLRSELRMLTPERLSDLASDPLVTIGCHTHGHELLDQLDDDSVLATLETANDLLQKWTDKLPAHFSYPNGNVNERVKKLVRKAGFITAVTTESRVCSAGDDLFSLPRNGVGRFDSRNHFKARMAGFL